MNYTREDQTEAKIILKRALNCIEFSPEVLEGAQMKISKEESGGLELIKKLLGII